MYRLLLKRTPQGLLVNRNYHTNFNVISKFQSYEQYRKNQTSSVLVPRNFRDLFDEYGELKFPKQIFSEYLAKNGKLVIEDGIKSLIQQYRINQQTAKCKNIIKLIDEYRIRVDFKSTYIIIIQGFTAENKFLEAYEIYQKIIQTERQERRQILSEEIYLILINCGIRNNNIEIVTKILMEMIENKLTTNVIYIHQIITNLLNIKSYSLIIELVRVVEEKIYLDDIKINELLKEFAKQSPEEINHLVNELMNKTNQYKPTSELYVSICSGLLKKIEQNRQFFEENQKNSISRGNELLFSTKQEPASEEVFKCKSSDLFSELVGKLLIENQFLSKELILVIICGCSIVNKLDQAVQILNDHYIHNYQQAPPITVFTAIISGYLENNDVQSASKLFYFMKEKFDLFNFILLENIFNKSIEILQISIASQLIIDFYEKMKEQGLEKDEFERMCESLVCYYTENNQFDEARDLVQSLIKFGYNNQDIVTRLFQSYLMNNDYPPTNLIETMKLTGIGLRVVHYNMMINKCISSFPPKIDDAIQLKNEILQNNLAPNITTYILLLTGSFPFLFFSFPLFFLPFLFLLSFFSFLPSFLPFFPSFPPSFCSLSWHSTIKHAKKIKRKFLKTCTIFLNF